MEKLAKKLLLFYKITISLLFLYYFIIYVYLFSKGYKNHHVDLVTEIVHRHCQSHNLENRRDNIVRRPSNSSSSLIFTDKAAVPDFDSTPNGFICSEDGHFKKSPLNLLIKCSDDFALQVLSRSADIPDFGSVGAKYDKNCRKSLYSAETSYGIK